MLANLEVRIQQGSIDVDGDQTYWGHSRHFTTLSGSLYPAAFIRQLSYGSFYTAALDARILSDDLAFLFLGYLRRGPHGPGAGALRPPPAQRLLDLHHSL